MKERFLKFGVFILIIQLTSCASRKDVVILQFDKVDDSKVSNNYQLQFKPDDMLRITITSNDAIAAQPFNLPVVAFSNDLNSAIGQPQLQTYLIDKDGNIEFPLLGTLKLGGLTRVQAIQMLKSKIDPDFIKNPIINITISNFKVTVQGDVTRPGTFSIPNERLSIFDAIGMAGGLNISARRDNVLIIREEGNKKNQYRINLTSNEALFSPVYYLQQNDVIYIEPNNAKIQDAAFTRTTGFFISLASVILSLLTILTR